MRPRDWSARAAIEAVAEMFEARAEEARASTDTVRTQVRFISFDIS